MSSQRPVPGLAMFATGCATLLAGAATGAMRVRSLHDHLTVPLVGMIHHGSCCRYAASSSSSGSTFSGSKTCGCSRRMRASQMRELNITLTFTKSTCSLDHCMVWVSEEVLQLVRKVLQHILQGAPVKTSSMCSVY